MRPSRIARAAASGTFALATLVAAERARAEMFAVTGPIEPREAVPDDTSPDPGSVPRDLGRLRLDDGRLPLRPPHPDEIVVDTRGEAQGRFEHWSTLPLSAPASDRTMTSLGQRTFTTEWVRVDARASYRERADLVAQIDLAPRWIIGDLAQGISADRGYAQDESVPALVRLRYLYLDLHTGIGLFRVGQVGSHWGMGILTNDGDHPSLFGDYRLGSLVERVAYATRPLGAASPFVVAVAADAILQDATSRWADGDRTWQGVASAYYDKGESFAGVYAARRWSKVRAFGNDGDLHVWVLDASARGALPLGVGDAFVYAEGEIATVFGTTDAIRTIPDYPQPDVRGFGMAARVGVVERGREGGRTFGRVAVEVEAGFASGDGNPYDGTLKRFTFDPNHVVGLVLFPFVMRVQSARAASNAMDPSLAARPTPGAFFEATHGGVAGAQYVFPTIVVRPTRNFDLKLGALVAVSTSDFVDPYRTAIDGSARNPRGGDARAHDLGLELDWGFEWRVPLEAATLQLGLQQGVLFPGHAFDDAQGNAMAWQSVTQGRVGLQF